MLTDDVMKLVVEHRNDKELQELHKNSKISLEEEESKGSIRLEENTDWQKITF